MQYFDLPAAVIFGIATLQGILLIINLFFNKKGSRFANILLLTLIVVITLIIFQNFIILSGSYSRAPHLIYLFFPLNGLIGPLFLLYVISLLNPSRGFKKYDLLHAFFFIHMLYYHWGFYWIPVEQKIQAVELFYYDDRQFDASMFPTIFFRRLVLISYALTSLFLITHRIKELREWSSDTNLQYLSRFKWITYLFLTYSIALLTGALYSFVFEVTTGHYEIYFHVINSAIMLTLAVIVMQQPERLIFILQPKPKPIKIKPSTKPELNSLKLLMQDTKPYLNPDLKLYDLAKISDIPPHILSDQINKELKINFYEFVNQYRVDEFKNRVASSKYNHFTFLAIAYDVGFNSKASFNRIFKKHTQMTPSQFVSQL